MEPLAGWCTPTEEEKEYIYLMVEKTWYYDCRTVTKQQVSSQKRKRLERKRDQKDEKEIADSAKRTQYAAFENIPVYKTAAELEDVLQSQHGDERPMYSTALKTKIVRAFLSLSPSSFSLSPSSLWLSPYSLSKSPLIFYFHVRVCAQVREQLNVRKWVYGRKFRQGFLDSGANDSSNEKLQNLKSTLKEMMLEEAKKSPTKRPPLIRCEYEVGPNPTRFRESLDVERNQITTAMEAEFLKSHPGRSFEGHKCLYDYGKGKPENPEAILQAKVGRLFPDGVIYYGIITQYNKKKRWWKAKHDEDGDLEDLNFRERGKMEHPPDLSSFRCSADGQAASTCAETVAMVKEASSPEDTESIRTVTRKQLIMCGTWKGRSGGSLMCLPSKGKNMSPPTVLLRTSLKACWNKQGSPLW